MQHAIALYTDDMAYAEVGRAEHAKVRPQQAAGDSSAVPSRNAWCLLSERAVQQVLKRTERVCCCP